MCGWWHTRYRAGVHFHSCNQPNVLNFRLKGRKKTPRNGDHCSRQRSTFRRPHQNPAFPNHFPKPIDQQTIYCCCFWFTHGKLLGSRRCESSPRRTITHDHRVKVKPGNNSRERERSTHTSRLTRANNSGSCTCRNYTSMAATSRHLLTAPLSASVPTRTAITRILCPAHPYSR